MKYIIVGLGNFGATLAEKLTARGNEVLGIDTDLNKVELFKEKISHTICMDATDELTVSGLPLKDTDMVIIAIGEDQGANIMSTALFKNFNVKRIISRAINPLQQKVLRAIGVDEIIHPEEDTADRMAKKLAFNNVVDSYELSGEHSIIESEVPEQFSGKTLEEIGFRKKFDLLVLATIKRVEVKSNIGKTRTKLQVQEIASHTMVLHKNDILVLFGENSKLQQFLDHVNKNS
ncbi:potassium channel family protein [Robertkochia solimangrovi]|uniref:potassium channel family protein n=1 Tax=Robertkochia solimangrovi TaxID=2213046 RepID=UPI00117DEB30|nr:TrkA family potassium uptake protein [Robertkochia solimangrovi]TRZ44316.1 TrkA family potassium uptake protein [Robertkochia solimangrovi]